MASDGIFDKLNNEDCCKSVWQSCNLDIRANKKSVTTQNQQLAQNIHQQCGLGVESVLKNGLYRQSLDNVTVVIVAF
jgi:serine/threonine protein phosphatase PrpC